MNGAAESSDRAISADVHCPKCAYSLFGAQGDRCSECGYPLDGLRKDESQIPWVHRTKVSWLTSYWRTVWMVVVRNRNFCEEYARPASFADARMFQLATIAHVYAAIIAVVALSYWIFVPDSRTDPTPLRQTIPIHYIVAGAYFIDTVYWAVWPAVLVLICLPPFLMMTVSCPSYFFHPFEISIERQNSAIALSHYASAPLALVPLLIVVHTLVLVQFHFAEWPGQTLALATGSATAIAASMRLWLLLRMAKRIMPQIRHRALLIAVAVPAIWIALLILFVCFLLGTVYIITFFFACG